MRLQLTLIGIRASPLMKKKTMPIQPSHSLDTEGVELYSIYSRELQLFLGFSEILLLNTYHILQSLFTLLHFWIITFIDDCDRYLDRPRSISKKDFSDL